jgi:hypothetical protein
MSKITTRGRIGRALTLTAGLLAVGVVIAPQALADPGDIGDTSLWRTSPRCSQPKNIILSAQGSGVLEFEYRVIGGEPTAHKSRPAAQPIMPRQVIASIPEGQIRWRVVAPRHRCAGLHRPRRGHLPARSNRPTLICG